MSEVHRSTPDAEQNTLEALLQELPAGIPLLPPEDRDNFAKYKYPPRIYKAGEAWRNCARALEAHDVKLCKAYREEIDTLLVFAGLFSSVVTAFSVESYQWLKSDSDDALLILLSQIAQSAFPNSTQPPALAAAETGICPSVRTRINAYWFLALSISLSAALIGILCKQWIREFERYADLAPKDFIGVRQMKYDGLKRWQVPGIIALLPVLLQLSLGLFALGILELLWQLHAAVAIAVSVPTSMTIVFYGATTFLPLIQHSVYSRDARSSLWTRLSQCPYKSPQALMAFSLYDALRSTAAGLFNAASSLQNCMVYFYNRESGSSDTQQTRVREQQPHQSAKPYSWNRIDLELLDFLDDVQARRSGSLPGSYFRGLSWLDRNMRRDDVMECIWNCLWEGTATPCVGAPLEWLCRGLAHITGKGMGTGPGQLARAGPRSIALLYMDHTKLPCEVIAEVFIQNLASVDTETATYFLSKDFLFRADPQLVVSLVRVVTSYCQSHAFHRGLGSVLVELTRIVTSSPEIPGLRRSALALFLTWLRAQSAPHPADVVEHSARALRHHLVALPARMRERPQGLHDSPCVRELAELATAVASISGRAVCWPLPDDVQTYFPDLDFYRSAGILGLLRELLRIATCERVHASGAAMPL